MTPESQLKSDVLDFLKRTGEWFIRMNSGKAKVRGGYVQMAPNGTADLLIVRRIPCWIELKKPGKNTTQKEQALAQAEFREKVLHLGHRHLTATTVDEVINFLRTER